jgi:hypothetical protein
MRLPPRNARVAGHDHCHGHDAMYCTEASASTGITDAIAIQLAHAAMNPTSVPCEYCP